MGRRGVSALREGEVKVVARMQPGKRRAEQWQGPLPKSKGRRDWGPAAGRLEDPVVLAEKEGGGKNRGHGSRGGRDRPGFNRAERRGGRDGGRGWGC